MYERCQVGLGDAQVDILRLDVQRSCSRLELQLPLRLQRALIANSCVQFEAERSGAQAVEVGHIEIQRTQLQGDFFLRYTIAQMHLIVAKLCVTQQNLPGIAVCCSTVFSRG